MKPRWSMILGLLVLGGSLAGTAQTNETLSFTNFHLPIPDGAAFGLSDHRSVQSGIARIEALRVRLRVEGEFNGDLYAYLRHVQAGVTNFAVLLNRPGRTLDLPWGYDDAGLDITLDDAAPNGDIHVYQSVLTPPLGTPLTGSWRPDGRIVDPALVLDTSPVVATLAAFNGADPSGEWTLFVADLESGATNLLAGWELELTGPAWPEVTWPTPADIVYGTALGPAQLNAAASVPGTFDYSPTNGAILHAGTGQILSVTFNPTDAALYASVTTNVTLGVLPKSLTVTAADATNVYGAALPALAATYAGFVNGDTEVVLDTPAVLSTPALPGSPVGTYPIAVGGAADPDYLVSFVPGTLSIVPSATAGVLSSSANPAAPGERLTLTLRLSAVAPGAGLPTGSVQFLADGSPVGVPATLNGGVASLDLATLPSGFHTLAAVYPGDGNFIGVTTPLAEPQLINSAPLAATDTIERDGSTGVKVQVATLLANDTDAEGDPIEWLSFSAGSAQGGTVIRSGNWIRYTPPPGPATADSFTYTIRDAHQAVATGTVVVLVRTNTLPSPNLVLTHLGNGSYRLEFDGIPGRTYRIESTGNLTVPSWQELGSAVADETGAFEFLHTLAPGTSQQFYRSVYP